MVGTNILHRRLTSRFLLNLIRAVAALAVVVGVTVLPSASEDLGKTILVLLDTIFPPALLIATLFTVGPMAHHHELTAQHAAGLSLWWIMRPLIVVAVAAALFSGVLRWTGVITPDPMLSVAAQQTNLHARLAYPLVHLFAVSIGIALASRPRRRTVYGGFIWALACLYGFHLITSIAQTFGRHGQLLPVIAGWLGSVVAVVVVVVLWRRARR